MSLYWWVLLGAPPAECKGSRVGWRRKLHCNDVARGLAYSVRRSEGGWPFRDPTLGPGGWALFPVAGCSSWGRDSAVGVGVSALKRGSAPQYPLAPVRPLITRPTSF